MELTFEIIKCQGRLDTRILVEEESKTEDRNVGQPKLEYSFSVRFKYAANCIFFQLIG